MAGLIETKLLQVLISHVIKQLNLKFIPVLPNAIHNQTPCKPVHAAKNYMYPAEIQYDASLAVYHDSVLQSKTDLQ
jgi:hypothetical protein